MAAIRMLAAGELRRRWRSLVVITLLVGVVGAVVLATAAGARRSGSALQRFNEYARSADVEVDTRNPTPEAIAAFERSPGVGTVAILHIYTLIPRGLSDSAIGVAVDDKMGTVIDRARLLSGRRADPNVPDEINVGETLAKLAHLRIGGILDVASLSPDQIEATIAGKDPGAPQGPDVRFRVVGITRRPLDLGDRAASGGVVVLTPAADRMYTGHAGRFITIFRVRTERGAADIPRVQQAARQIFGADPFFSLVDASLERSGAANAINVLTTALWIFAAVTAAAGAVALGIIVTRDIALTSGDQDTLCSLGLTRGQRIVARAPRIICIAVGGGLLAVGFAVLASPFLPLGIARRADPDVGLHADWIALGVGLAVIVFFVMVVAGIAALRATRRASLDSTDPARGRRSMIADLAAGAAVPVSVATGVRMAVQRGHGEAAVPVVSAFVGLALGVMGVTGVLVFASNLGRLEATPRLYGWTWDFKAPDNTFGDTCGRGGKIDFGLEQQPGVTDVASVCYQSVDVEGRPVTGWGFESYRGTIEPEVIEGRAPSTADEVALGTVTLRALHKKVGDTVEVQASEKKHSYRVVGRAVFPRLSTGDIQPLADGAAFTGAGLRTVFNSDDYTRYLLGRFAPGVDRGAVERRLGTIAAFQAPSSNNSFGSEVGAHGPTTPPEVDRLRHIDWFLPSLAALLTTLALIAVGHALVTSVRRRRRDLAMFKTLGFDRRQVRTAVAWQATTLAIFGLLVGIPFGVLVGEYAWRRVAEGVGVSGTAAVPILVLLAMGLITLLLVNLIAYLPARAAARTRVAVALQAE